MKSSAVRLRDRAGRAAAVGALAWLALGTSVGAADSETLKIATWNLEWLIAPEQLRRLAPDCTRSGAHTRATKRSIPCDVATGYARTSTDFKALARYAGELDADVIALQEVDGAEAARLIFRGYDFCFTGRTHVQNTGFAVRTGLRHRCGADQHEVSLADSVRRGAELILFPDEPRELRLLSVHLKSGCSRAPLDSRADACRDLARQVPALEAWIDAQARAGLRFAVLGDFNRDLLAERGAARGPDGRVRQLWPEIDDADPAGADLVNAAQGQRFLNCAPGHAFDSYIDFIVLGRSAGVGLVPGSFQRVVYQPRDVYRQKLSDHCPIAVRVRL